jgi:methylmalonyl-CoA mutase N-terminal domain/subunit
MFKEDPPKKVEADKRKWMEDLSKVLCESPERLPRFTTVSDLEIKGLYTPEDTKDIDYSRDIGFPGVYPFTRGVQPSMYRGRLWTMRMFSGLGGPEETNKRFHYLLSHGETGLSIAFHYPTLMGYDSDSPMSRGEIGKCGVAIDTLKDMEVLFEGIPLDKVTTSMTINPPASILLAMYIVVAEKQGVSKKAIGGTIQNDMLKEFIAQKTFMLPPKPSLRIIVDTIEYCAKEVPRWNTISISGYHIREAGATAVQEVAFTFANAIAYVEAALKAGLQVDQFAPQLTFFFAAQNHLLEEVAKFRAARRLWAKLMHDRFNAMDPKSMMLRFHTQTAGVALTAQQPFNNVVRVTIQALSAVLGGTQSLHTNSMDEALSLPSEETVQVALRTQQIIAHESGVTDTVDPLAGSYYLESLTDEIERRARDYLTRIDKMGGVLGAIEAGYMQSEIQESAYRYQQAVESKQRIVVGVNQFQAQEEHRPRLLRVDESAQAAQAERLKQLRAGRDQAAVTQALTGLEAAARGSDNLMPYIVAAVEAYATIGEMCNVLRRVFGEYQQPVGLA